MKIEKILSYYQECYRQEFRDSNILNYLGAKVDERFYFENISKLYQEQDTAIIDQNLGEELYKYMELHKKEKTLVASSFFITGKLDFLGKKQTICAPIISTPVSLEKNTAGIYFFNYNFEENSCNTTLLNIIKNNFDLPDTFLEEIIALLKNGEPKEQNIQAIAKKINNHVSIDITDLQKLPSLVADKQLKQYARKTALKLAPAFSVGIIEKSKSSRGVLNEIEEIKEDHLYNDMLRTIFSGDKIWPTKKNNSEEIYVPANLTVPQTDIIQGAKSSDVNVVIGPPGTGKSYTIAALAIDMAYHNKSVLICSKTDQAVNVLQDKIVHDLGVTGLSVRAGVGRSYKTVLKKKISSILHFKSYTNRNDNIQRKKSIVSDRLKKIADIEKEIQKREETEIENGLLFTEENPSFFRNIKKKYTSYKVLRELPFWVLIDVLHDKILEKNQLVKHLIKLQYKSKIDELLQHSRGTFQDLLKLIKSKNAVTKTGLFEAIDYELVLQCLPIWITKSADISEALPLQNDLFDIAIIDEASQCDIATMIPILARAKKIVIVGDPKQLRHVSFLSKEAIEKIAKDNTLTVGEEVVNYRTHSFLDYLMERINSQDIIHFLDEHYRSLPGIINYSNHKFYNDNLKIMSDLQIHQQESAVQWIFCDGAKEKNGSNIAEADRVLKDVQKLIVEETDLPYGVCTTIGILSPFRGQVDYLKKKIEEFDLISIKKHKIAVGTPFSFQGEERDAMYITFTIDNSTSASIFQYLDKEDVFNVSITRAKKKQFLYYSFTPKGFKNKHLLIDYFYESQVTNSIQNTNKYIDRFTHQVHEALLALRIQESDILINYLLAGHAMDMLFTHNNRVVCIDLVGYPGALERTFSIEQYKMLLRTKIAIITIPYAYWHVNKEACIAHIAKKAGIPIEV